MRSALLLKEEKQSFYDLESWKENLRNARPQKYAQYDYTAACYDKSHLLYCMSFPLIILLLCFPELFFEPPEKEKEPRFKDKGLRAFYQYEEPSFEWKDKHKISKKNMGRYKFKPPGTSSDITNDDLKAFYPVFLAKHPHWKTYTAPEIRYKEDIKKQKLWEVNCPYPSQMKQKPGAYRELEWFKYLIRIPIVKEPPDPFQKWYPISPDPVKYFGLNKLKYRQLSIDPSIEVLNTRIRKQKELKIYGWGREMTVHLDFYASVSLGKDDDIIETRQNEEFGHGTEIMSSSLCDIIQSQEDRSPFLNTFTLDFNEKHLNEEHISYFAYMGYIEKSRLTLSNILWDEENITWSIWKQQRRGTVKPNDCHSQMLPGERWMKVLKAHDTTKPRNERVYCKTRRGVSAFWKPVFDECDIAFKDAIVADDGFSLELVKNMDFFNYYFKKS